MLYRWAMADELPGYRTSSARRGGRGSPVLITAAAGLVAIFVVLVTLDRGPRSPEPPPPPPPTRTSPPPAPVPPTATVLVEHSSQWVIALGADATPSPWPTFAPVSTAAPRPQPSPTPILSAWVTYRWSAGQVFTPSAHVLVEIQAVNRCNRDLGPLDLWFEITGWRQGGQVQSVRGHPFDRIRKGGSAIVAIGLPGSIDWYDEITVEVVD